MGPIAAFSAVSLAASGLLAQSFEVAVVKPTDPSFQGRTFSMQGAHRFVARGQTLKSLIAGAYNLTPRLISGGPAWADGDRYDITASTPGETRPRFEDQMAMLRQLLAERFQLGFHREPRELPIYELSVAKGGAKLTESRRASDGLAITLYPGPAGTVVRALFPARDATMAEVAGVLQRAALDRPVVDRTGLTGRYDFNLEWTPDESQFGGRGAKPERIENSEKPDLIAAIQQQLGLKLEAVKGRVDALVIDRATRPSEN